MDNGSSHTSHATRNWIAAHPRITVTYTPKHASWLDMAELWFSTLTRGLLRRGEFTSRADLAGKITSFAVRYNRTARPHTWTYDAAAGHERYLTRHARHDGPAVPCLRRRAPSKRRPDQHQPRTPPCQGLTRSCTSPKLRRLR